ncbi:response regulator [Kitasatospora sp. NA04385]|uniref:response regulator n=1 Tax=Kitasatospora sp. NA04385 TaxID=2742135 RepID=UPI0020CB2E86|nr:response regulator [Kitasatospora sp. NA04385]
MTAVDGLPPLDAGLGAELREFTGELRALFLGLGPAADAFAARCGTDPEVLADYLTAVRVPPWEFVETLLDAVRGSAPSPVVRERLYRSRMAALRVARPIGRAVCQLEGQLHAAEREMRQAEERAEQTGQALAELDAADPAGAGRAELLAEEYDRAREQSARAGARRTLLQRQLALVERQQGTSAAPPAPTGAEPGDGPPPKILLVDDRRENLVVLEALLGSHGHQLVAATSGPAALRALMEPDGYAAILLDVQMPGMDGYETAAHIRSRARTRDIPIVFVTAIGSEPDHAARAYAAGAADFLPKPVDPWAVRAKVASFVELHHARHPGA